MVFIGKTIDYMLHLGACEETYIVSKELRMNMTKAEKYYGKS